MWWNLPREPTLQAALEVLKDVKVNPPMYENNFDLNDLVLTSYVAKDTGWPIPSPFNLSFRSKRPSQELSTALTGSGIYLISYEMEVVYIGMYRPTKGRIIDDRWKRHLQTITGRGTNIGFGGINNPERRRDQFLAAIESKGLREAIHYACRFSRETRFKDTGYNTTPNRLRFASEKWSSFGTAASTDILNGFSFCLLRIRVPDKPMLVRQSVKDIETDVLKYQRPVCNTEYKHAEDCMFRVNNTVPAITQLIRRAAKNITGHDLTHFISLV